MIQARYTHCFGGLSGFRPHSSISWPARLQMGQGTAPVALQARQAVPCPAVPAGEADALPAAVDSSRCCCSCAACISCRCSQPLAQRARSFKFCMLTCSRRQGRAWSAQGATAGSAIAHAPWSGSHTQNQSLPAAADGEMSAPRQAAAPAAATPLPGTHPELRRLITSGCHQHKCVLALPLLLQHPEVAPAKSALHGSPLAACGSGVRGCRVGGLKGGCEGGQLSQQAS